MKNEKPMTRITSEELKSRKTLHESRTDWGKVDAIPEDELNRLIADDPDEGKGVLEIDWSKIEPVSRPAKKMVNLRLDSDMLAWFRDTGRGYQTRMNAVLRAYYEQAKDARG